MTGWRPGESGFAAQDRAWGECQRVKDGLCCADEALGPLVVLLITFKIACTLHYHHFPKRPP